MSILFGIGEPELAATVREGHEAAVEEALAYLEREACVVRRGKGGAVQLPGEGFVAAGFRHRASRAGDPLLHTHVVVANTACGPDDRWTALFGRRLYAETKAAGFLYQAVLRDELSERLGLGWNPVVNGVADVQGVPRELIETFSTRRHEVLEAMQRRGEHSARAAQIATLDTRRGKTLTPALDQREEWRRVAGRSGLGARTVEDARALPSWTDPEPPTADDVRDFLLGERGLTVQRSSFDRSAVLQGVAQASREGARVAALEQRASELLADPRVVPLGDGRYSTHELVELERQLLDRTQERREEPAPRADRMVLDAAAKRRTLSPEQTEMVERLVLGRGGVQIVRAPAGTGKTFALDAAREAWQTAEVPVLGCALSARAACELRDQAAIDATTIARLRTALDHGSRIQPNSVLIVDEAGMVGTRDLAALAHATDQAGARLVLVGDDRQLPEIDAGGAFGELARRGPTIELSDVRRQAEPWDRAALAELRNGDLDAFVDSYAQHGRIVARPTAQAAREQLVEDWWKAVEDDKEALMLAHRRADVTDLNERARERMRAAGRLGEREHEHGERSFAVGDRVIATRNDWRLGTHNGQAGTLAEIGDGRMTVQLADGAELELPTGYAAAGHLDHGYALTTHRAQGATVDATFVLGSDDVSREWGYTALSRHRDEARFYVSARPAFLNEPAAPLTTPEDISSAVYEALVTSRAKQLAVGQADRRRAAQVEHAEERVDRADARHASMAEEVESTSWFRFGARTKLRESAERLAGEASSLRHQRDAIRKKHDHRAARPALATALDPLDRLEPPTPSLHRDVPEPADLDPGPDLDLGW